MKKILAASCLVMLLFSTGALAEDGYYFSTSLGYSAGGENRAAVTENILWSKAATDPIGVDLEMERGAALGLAVGYRFGRFRLEGELGLESHLVKDATLYGAAYNSDSDISKVSLMMHGYYDIIDLGPLTPYITAGVGGTQVAAEDLAIETLPPSMTDRNLFTGKNTVFLYQVGAGVGFAVNDMWTIDLKYRFLDVDNADFPQNIKRYFGPAVVSLQSHIVFAGVRVAL